MVATSAHADVAPPRRRAAHAAMFEGLDRFPDERFFLVSPKGEAKRVKQGELIPVTYDRPRLALWSVRGGAPDDGSIDGAWLRASLANERASSVARTALDGYVSLTDSDSPTTHVLTVYEVKGVEERRVVVERKRVESYQRTDDYVPEDPQEGPWGWYERPQPPRVTTRTRARWPIPILGIGAVIGAGVVLAVAVFVRRRRRRAA